MTTLNLYIAFDVYGECGVGESPKKAMESYLASWEPDSQVRVVQVTIQAEMEPTVVRAVLPHQEMIVDGICEIKQ